jgi:hypothetical protein
MLHRRRNWVHKGHLYELWQRSGLSSSHAASPFRPDQLVVESVFVEDGDAAGGALAGAAALSPPESAFSFGFDSFAVLPPSAGALLLGA